MRACEECGTEFPFVNITTKEIPERIEQGVKPIAMPRNEPGDSLRIITLCSTCADKFRSKNPDADELVDMTVWVEIDGNWTPGPAS